MAAAGRRALATVRAVLREYRDAPWNPGVLPWLVPWSGAAEGAVPTPGTIAGRLPLAPTGGVLVTSFRVTGAPAGGFVSATGTVDASAVGLPAQPLTVPAGRCTWTVAARIDCEGEGRLAPRSPAGSGGSGSTCTSPAIPPSRLLRRPTSAAVRFEPPGGPRIRTSRSSIRPGERRPGGGGSGSPPARFRARSKSRESHIPLAVGEEVPEWVLRNEWHRTLMVGSAPAFVPGGGAACSTPIDCLDVVRTTLDGRRDESPAIAVAVLAGTRLDHQSRSGSGLARWFEGENANPANLPLRDSHSNEFFNDRIAAVTPGPGASPRDPAGTSHE